MSGLPKGGKILTAEQSVRLALLDSVSREKAIGFIVQHIRYRPSPLTSARKAGSTRGRGYEMGTPRAWYARPV